MKATDLEACGPVCDGGHDEAGRVPCAKTNRGKCGIQVVIGNGPQDREDLLVEILRERELGKDVWAARPHEALPVSDGDLACAIDPLEPPFVLLDERGEVGGARTREAGRVGEWRRGRRRCGWGGRGQGACAR